jgi:hypothetical protein
VQQPQEREQQQGGLQVRATMLWPLHEELLRELQQRNLQPARQRALAAAAAARSRPGPRQGPVTGCEPRQPCGLPQMQWGSWQQQLSAEMSASTDAELHQLQLKGQAAAAAGQADSLQQLLLGQQGPGWQSGRQRGHQRGFRCCCPGACTP